MSRVRSSSTVSTKWDASRSASSTPASPRSGFHHQLWAATAGLRAKQTGERVWTFDPQRITYAAQSWWWNPLRGLAGVVEAERTRDIWGPAAQELVAALLLAAARAGRTISDVYTWLADDRNPEPAESLDAAGLGAMAASLRGIQGSPDETRGSVYFTARVAVKYTEPRVSSG